MSKYSSLLDNSLGILAGNYDGSSESALTIDNFASWEFFLYAGDSRNYAKETMLPSFMRIRKALKEIHPEDSSLVKGIIGTFSWRISVLRHYIKTGEFKAVSDKRLRELRKIASVKFPEYQVS